LALVGILLGLAFSRPRGERLPAWLVLLPVWVGTGLLVPMVLLAPMLGPAAVARDQAAGAAPTWSYEQLFVIVSLVGVGVGLPVAFAGYAKARWPEALGGRSTPVNRPGTPASCSCRWPAWWRWGASCSASRSCSGCWVAQSGSTQPG
jgi:hypothetical protein